jgi:hypothetical protein
MYHDARETDNYECCYSLQLETRNVFFGTTAHALSTRQISLENAFICGCIFNLEP